MQRGMAVNGSDVVTYPLEVQLGPDGLFHSTGIAPPPGEDAGCHLDVMD